MHEHTHASFFSGVGGFDQGLERAGWHTVSHSEIDPYASAVLAERWPGVPNLGDITSLASTGGEWASGESGSSRAQQPEGGRDGHADSDWRHATLWSGGFPCTDLSIAGKRAGLINEDGERTRSGLAFAFLDLVERHRPEAILLENVYGLLSSNTGRDLGSLIRQMDELGYVGAWRGTDAQWFGVPQRRKRVFILAFDAQRHPDPDGPGKVLAVGTRCGRDHPKEREAWAQASRGVAPSAGRLFNATARFAEWVGPDDYAGTVSARDYKSSNHLVSAPADPGGVRAPDGLAGWMDHRPLVAGPEAGSYHQRDRIYGRVAPSLDANAGIGSGKSPLVSYTPSGIADDDLLPIGLDSHRYRCIGNGVVAPVAYWIGTRLRRYFETCA